MKFNLYSSNYVIISSGYFTNQLCHEYPSNLIHVIPKVSPILLDFVCRYVLVHLGQIEYDVMSSKFMVLHLQIYNNVIFVWNIIHTLIIQYYCYACKICCFISFLFRANWTYFSRTWLIYTIHVASIYFSWLITCVYLYCE